MADIEKRKSVNLLWKDSDREWEPNTKGLKAHTAEKRDTILAIHKHRNQRYEIANIQSNSKH